MQHSNLSNKRDLLGVGFGDGIDVSGQRRSDVAGAFATVDGAGKREPSPGIAQQDVFFEECTYL